MPTANQNPIFDTLRHFSNFAELDDSQLRNLANQAEILRAQMGDTLLELGSEDSRLLFLIQGELRLVAGDGASHLVRDTDIAAQGPVSRLRPSRYQVVAETPVRYMMVEQYVLDNYSQDSSGPSMLVQETYLSEPNELIDDNATHPLMFDVFYDHNKGRIVVPSDADIAIRVGRALRPLEADGERLAETLSICPALTLKAVRAASADPDQIPPVHSCREAVERLGKDETYGLAVNCILRESLRTASPLIRNRMHIWWERTIRVAAVSRVLAECSEQFEPDYAALIGLLHSIAEPVLLGYADRHSDLLEDSTALDNVVYDNRAELGRMLAESWELPHEIAEAITMANHWEYESKGEPDYTDIMLVAQWHANIGQMHSRPLPSQEEIPAFRRLGLHVASADFLQRIDEVGDRAVEQIDTLLDA